MSTLHFVDIKKENLFDVCLLSNTLSETHKKFVATNAYSVAQAHYYPECVWFKGIYVGDEPVGFIMADIKMADADPEDVPGVFLWRFMIGGEHQGKGYGKEALRLFEEQLKAEGKKFFFTSCGLGEGGPYDFYIKQGFIDTGKMEDDEQILRKTL